MKSVIEIGVRVVWSSVQMDAESHERLGKGEEVDSFLALPRENSSADTLMFSLVKLTLDL